MPKTKKKTKPITQRHDASITHRFKQSSSETAKLIRQYHTLNKELAKCRATGNVVREKEIVAEMESMGGLDWYQRASQLGQSKQRGGDSSKWLVQVLKRHHLQRPSMRVLDVGALSPDNYRPYQSWIEATPIDLNPQDPRITKQDFLKMAPRREFDIVSLSLVVNFVGDPKDRGQMLIHSRDFLLDNGLLFLVLPLPCITNSRYMSHDHLLQMMNDIGYTTCIQHHFSNKLAYYLFQLDNNTKTYPAFKRKVLSDGGGKNNFSIVIQPQR
ncbi:hypothetical protein O0I10_009968 [Lichtheimia ornata]|uniref:25S rRNA adenine-N(1) methyltransferase n=1 Tax=Lichtheimia ornata TaxID=688661 RepID=A0AAD7UVL9_9FUNG|nr:uncharacterized protein O0I10_009968 [Lichtheimia ornata]KAJ8654399.1 hypothetical protein O0I10_009968 [Lichtheimia ornata]